jgi:hypothetical protein
LPFERAGTLGGCFSWDGNRHVFLAFASVSATASALAMTLMAKSATR